MNCILLSNTSIYDLINIYNIIDYLSKKYNILYIFIENLNINFCKLKTASLECIANEKPIKANGKAKMV